ncbi:uncharacterized protein LOC111340604 [Stylophora pistillata]|uniref:uncharacterized protein LOC111340604 n=1 Tax=Stylophora pistillata TaxID=50429 RepID=UPI000C03F09B|nr:uncharacterized protein LOC111340604 [Stylophora pistillata]
MSPKVLFRGIQNKVINDKFSFIFKNQSLTFTKYVGVKENRTATATESPPTRPVEQGGNDRKWALIGVFCGLVVVIVIIVGIAYWRSKKSHEKSPQDTFSQVGVVMKSHHLQSNVEHENGLENES